MQTRDLRTLASIIALVASALLVVDLFGDWRAARVNVGGVVVVQSGTAGWNGVGALAGLAAIVVVAAELAHLAGRRDRPLLVLGASLTALVASVAAAVSTTSSGVEVDSQVTVEPDVVLWAARTGIALAGIAAAAATTGLVLTRRGAARRARAASAARPGRTPGRPPAPPAAR